MGPEVVGTGLVEESAGSKQESVFRAQGKVSKIGTYMAAAQSSRELVQTFDRRKLQR